MKNEKVWIPLDDMTDEEILKESARRRALGETAHANELLVYLNIRNAIDVLTNELCANLNHPLWDKIAEKVRQRMNDPF